MVVDEALGLAQADAVDDRGVVEGVGDDGVLGAQEALEEAAVGVEAGGIEDGVLHLEKSGDLLLQLQVQVLRSADEADRGQAEAVLVKGLAGGFQDLGVVGQAEVVVGAKIQDVARRAAGREGDANVGLLVGEDRPLLFIQARALDL